MTTKIIIENDASSNGDLHIVTSSGFGTPIRDTLFPGDPKLEKWVSTGHVITIQETWPTAKPAQMPAAPPAAAPAEAPAAAPASGITETGG